jgi:hypothetical protein
MFSTSTTPKGGRPGRCDLLAQQFRLDAEAGDHRLEPALRLALHRDFAALDAGFTGSPETLSPLTQRGNRHTILREVLSRSAPRGNSRITLVLRRDDQRPAPARPPDSGVCSVVLRAPLCWTSILLKEHSLSQMFPVMCPAKFRAGASLTCDRPFLAIERGWHGRAAHRTRLVQSPLRAETLRIAD